MSEERKEKPVHQDEGEYEFEYEFDRLLPRLVEMGFDRDKSVQALLACRGDENAAIDFLRNTDLGLKKRRVEERDQPNRTVLAILASMSDWSIGAAALQSLVAQYVGPSMLQVISLHAQEPSAVAVDDKRVYVSTHKPSRLLVFGLDGEPVPLPRCVSFKISGSFPARFKQKTYVSDNDGTLCSAEGKTNIHPPWLSSPTGLALDSGHSKLFVSDTQNARIVVLDTKTLGTLNDRIDGVFPYGLSYSQSLGALSVVDATAHFITSFVRRDDFRSWEPVQMFCDTGGRYHFPLAVACAQDNDELFVVDNGHACVQVIGTEGWVRKWGKVGKGKGEFDNPRSVAVHPVSGNVFVGEIGNMRVQEFTPKGNFVGVWCDPDMIAPSSVCFSPDGSRMYVTDYVKSQVQVYVV